MKKIIAVTLITLSFILGVSSSQIKADTAKVTICHSTSSHTNPYVTENPAADGDVSGHDDHSGGIYPVDPWGDIIPPFDYVEKVCTGTGQDKTCEDATKHYDGKNWTTEGQAILRNGCKIPGPTHLTCRNQACVVVDGEGENSCSLDTDCQENQPSPTPTPQPQVFVGLGKNGPTCTSNTFTARLTVKANGVGQSGIKVTFNYKSDEKTATTDANGEAAVDFEFKGNGEITAKSDGYPTQQIGVEGVKDCSSTTTNGGGSTGEVLGTSTQSQGQVLGAMAPTGNGLADVMNLVFGAGAGLIGLGMNTYAKKNR